MRIDDIETLLKGEQGLSERILKTIPLIEKHFKSFDNKRALIASGGHSAPFQKVCTAFRDELAELMPYKEYQFNAFIDASHSSVWIKFKYCMLNNKGGCSYYEHGTYFADLTGDNREIFKYKYDIKEDSKKTTYEQDTHDMCDNILNITLDQLIDKREIVDSLNDQIETIESSIPYQLKKALKS